jgi:hypothetical protein
MTPLSKYQLERADLTVTIEQGRRVENELFAENSRGLQTMGELLKARMFGATEYAINLRKRMTNYVRGEDSPQRSDPTVIAEAPPEPHSWPCDDPFCQPCEDGVKRLLRDVGVIPQGKRLRRPTFPGGKWF